MTVVGDSGVESLWQELVDDCANGLGQKGHWRRFYPTTFPDGSPISFEFRPILDVLSETQAKAIAVSRVEDLDSEMCGFLRTLGVEGDLGDFDLGDFDGVSELVLEYSIGEKDALTAARTTIERWMDKDTTPESMREFLRDSA